ncbi:carboxylesterase/lipase family protein [Alicyclobacillus cycloheptanicus]|uniref:Carboxylic ester hydrolase n=1 Tax=Alicyclobacillus cycloheptanicus TaxID=1457 RepID=A0ABT9XMG3_9BACL|nr:carboxylesterase/lipase family protein [Alicyclobacillus cycloheptanicus]MDQ0191502.1 para-nitrobenzyl esterase [Alicyclobacillus cycloheptanicus]WDL99995.1 carboxylesterase/lipase family protein [Alicyclobacillus cycloheptanicus]
MTDVLAETRFGLVEGVREGEVMVWKGVPYAAPPMRALRFRPPQEPVPWSGVREAKVFGPASLQGESPSMRFLGDAPVKQDEDCLYLNIWSPSKEGNRRPVMVWIHGGSFHYGSGSSRLYDGRFFAEHGDVVVVTINYRLGVFGFLYLDAFGGEKYRESANCGLLDQVAALKWVHDNIEAFGGDPTNVTIFGESAGAVSVGCLLSMPIARGLFHKAILQSGTARSHVTVEQAAKMTEQLLFRLQLDEDSVSELESIPAEAILRATEIFPRRAFGPVGDGIHLARQPEKVLDEGFAKDIPVLVGTNKDESRLFTHFDSDWTKMDDQELRAVFERSFGPLWTSVSQYIIHNQTLSRALYEDLMTHYVFTYPAIFFSEGQARHGAPVWMYRFDYESNSLDGCPQAFHALEIPFVWNTVMNPEVDHLAGNDSARYKLAKQMHNAWIAFARCGDPNTTELPAWPKYDLDNRATMLFHTKCEVVHDPDRQKRLKWETVFKRPNS